MRSHEVELGDKYYACPLIPSADKHSIYPLDKSLEVILCQRESRLFPLEPHPTPP